MYVEQRIYTLVPGGVAEYLKIYAECGRDAQEKILGNALGCFTTEIGDLNQLIYLWPYESMEERTRLRTILMADADFKKFRGLVKHLLVKQQNTIMIRALPMRPANA